MSSIAGQDLKPTEVNWPTKTVIYVRTVLLQCFVSEKSFQMSQISRSVDNLLPIFCNLARNMKVPVLCLCNFIFAKPFALVKVCICLILAKGCSSTITTTAIIASFPPDVQPSIIRWSESGDILGAVWEHQWGSQQGALTRESHWENDIGVGRGGATLRACLSLSRVLQFNF